MWDLGLLVHRGPLVVSPDISFEPAVVRPAVAAAMGVDHRLFVDRLADTLLDERSFLYGVWSLLGGVRFIEDYLALDAVDAPGYARLLDRSMATRRSSSGAPT